MSRLIWHLATRPAALLGDVVGLASIVAAVWGTALLLSAVVGA